MISGATRGAGGPPLGTHLGNAQGNERVMTLEGRGLVSDGIREQVAELTRMVSHARTRTPLYHVHADPPAEMPWSSEERSEYWQRFEREFGLEGRPFAAVAHSKEGRDHEHRVYARVRPDGTAIRMDHDHARREKINRVFEFDRGESLTKGAHNRAIIAALEVERPDVVAAMLSAGLHEGPRPRAKLTPEERQQQDRTKVLKADVATATAAAWNQGGTGQDFATALADHGLRLARGDSSPVVVDATGNTHAVARMLAMAAKASKTDAPKAAAINERLSGMDLPTVAEATAAQRIVGAAPDPSMVEAAQGITADLAPAVSDRGQPTPAPVVQASTPSPKQEAAKTAVGEQTTAPSRDATHAPQASAGGGGNSAPAGQDSGGGIGASLGDAGEGPGEPPGPNASPDERSKWLAKDQAYRERKAGIWAAWIASQKQPAQAVSSMNKGLSGGQENADIWKQTETTEQTEGIQQLIEELRKSWQRAASTAEIRRAIEQFKADSAAVRATAAERRDDRAAGSQPTEDYSHDIRDARVGGAGSGIPGRHGDPEGGRRAEQDRGTGASPGDDSGEPSQVGAQGRQALEHHATEARLEKSLAAQPEAMARMRAATQALLLDPFANLQGRAWFEAVSSARNALHARYTEQRTASTFDEWLTNQGRIDPTARAVIAAVAEQKEKKAAAKARVADDRNKITSILSIHPHPDPNERDPVARELREERTARDEHTASRAAEAAATEAAAKAAFRNRDPATWMRNVFFGQPTAAQQRALDAAGYAECNRNTRPDDGTLKAARERGRLLALGARDRTQAWEAKPDVVAALEHQRLNGLVAAAAASGDPQVSRALKAGDPDAARAAILAREEVERSQQEEMERRQAMQRGPGRPEPATGGPPGPRSPR